MSDMMNYRKEIVNQILPHARRDSSIHLLVGDMGFGAIDQYQHELPEHVFNLGMMEQGMVGIAAGMAMTGLKPIVYSIVNFLAFRALEQIRNDVVLQKLNVKFIATGVDDYFEFLGYSHCCGKDDVKIMEIIGLKVYDPYQSSPDQFEALVADWLNDPEPAYLRV